MCRVAYVAGSGRSGSTLLDRILGSLPGFVSVGEVRLIWQEGLLENRSCGCGARFRDCSFWAEVGLTAYGGWDNVNAAEVADLAASTSRNRYYPWLLYPRYSPAFFKRRLRRYVGILERLYSSIAEVSGAGVVVDSSKDPAYGLALSRSGTIDLRILHLVRDSRGVAYSWQKRLGSDPHTGRPLLPVYSPFTTGVRWLAFNVLAGLMRRSERPIRRITYERFLASPSHNLAEIAKFIDGSVHVAELRSLDEGRMDFQVSHTVSGHPTRLQQGNVRLRLDDEWVTRMGPFHRYAVALVTWPLLLRYGYPLWARPVAEQAKDSFAG